MVLIASSVIVVSMLVASWLVLWYAWWTCFLQLDAANLQFCFFFQHVIPQRVSSGSSFADGCACQQFLPALHLPQIPSSSSSPIATIGVHVCCLDSNHIFLMVLLVARLSLFTCRLFVLMMFTRKLLQGSVVGLGDTLCCFCFWLLLF